MTAQEITGRDVTTGASIAITVDNGRIAVIEPSASASDAWLAPGLVDLQVNGYAGHDLNGADLTEQTVVDLAAAMLSVGVTRFVPTLITSGEAALLAGLATIAQARRANPRLQAMIPYIHVEGPHIADRDGPRGAHPRTDVRDWDLAEFARWQSACDGLVGMVTLSPHDAAALPYIAGLSQAGVHVAIGHSDASPEQIHAAADAGAVLSTHLGNGVASQLPRHPNLLWAQLADDRLSATFIADGHHLPADTLKAMIRAKGVERSILVSDSVALGGLAPGVYDAPVGGRVELRADGRLGLVGTPFLAGAALSLKSGVARVVADTGLSLEAALGMANANPARFAGGGGVLGIGARADLFRFNWSPGDLDLRVDACWLGGVPTSFSQ